MKRLTLIKQEGFQSSAILLITLLYAIGAMSYAMQPSLRTEILQLFPWGILTLTLILLFFHPLVYDLKNSLLLISIALIGFIISLLGVNTGFPFGSYHYGEALGIKLWNTPLIMGLNWLCLVLVSHSITQSLHLQKMLGVIVGALLILLYILLFELVAPRIEVWNFTSGSAPIGSYLSWFIIGFGFHYTLLLLKIKANNATAYPFLLLQTLFLIVLLVS